ncbi:unnamed protein product [Closterium sp. NIES-54]
MASYLTNEAERPLELLAHVNYVASVKQGSQPRQHEQSGGGGSSGWKPTKDANKKKSAKDSGRGGGSRRRECWLCGDPDHISFECPDRSDSDDDDAKGGRGRPGSHRPHRVRNQLRKEKQSTKSSTSAKDADSSDGGKGAGGCQRSTGDPQSILGKGYRHVGLGAYGRTDPLLNKPFYPNGLVVGILTPRRASEPAFSRPAEGERREATRGWRWDVARLGGGRRPRSGILHRASPLHQPASLLGEVDNGHDGGRGPAGNRLDDEVAAGQAACKACTRRHESHLELSKAQGRHWAGSQLDDWRGLAGSDANDVLAVVHIDLCGPFRVAAKYGSQYFLLLKDSKTRYVWMQPVTKKSDVLQEFVKWLAVTERQAKKSVLMLRSDWGGEFLGKQFTDFVNGKGIVHNLTCPYTPQQNGMAEREMRTVVESQGTTPYQLLTGKKPDLSLAQVWGCMAQFLVPEQQRCGKLQPKARWGLHLGVSEERKGWELLDITDNRVVTTSDVVFYKNMSLEVWKSEHGPASGRTPTIPPTDTSTATIPLLAEVGEPAAENIEDVPSPFPSPALRSPPLVADLRGVTPMSASGNEGRSGASRVAPAKSIAGGRRDVQQVDVRVKSMPPGEEQAEEVQPTVVKSAKGAGTRQQLTGEQAAAKPTKK